MRKGFIFIMPEIIHRKALRDALDILFPKGYDVTEKGAVFCITGECEYMDELRENELIPQYTFHVTLIDGIEVITNFERI